VILEAEHGGCELLAEVEAGGVLALQGDEIAPEGEVVAHDNGKAGAELDGHGLVVCGAEPQAAVPSSDSP